MTGSRPPVEWPDQRPEQSVTQWPRQWPSPGDPGRAAALQQDLAGRDPGLTAMPTAAGLIACLGGNSPFLADLARREHALLAQLLRHGPSRVAAAALRRLRSLEPGLERPRIASGLRRAKRQLALVAAVADLGGIWTLEQVTGTLSLLAEAALRVAVAHLLAGIGETRRRSGFVVLGMGKLGARELNYSSDIDLLLLYDPAAHPDRDDQARSFVRLAADLVALMQAPDADGIVFRVDLRLRPDPGATPPAVSLPTALAYYERHGLNWERAAMIKARPLAGDLELGRRFLTSLRPFVWRRHLDFAAIADIRAMKRRIDRQVPARTFGAASRPSAAASGVAADGPGALLGYDVKLGHGGIREIEFIAQTLQLVWGGREPSLRDPATLVALQRLQAAGYLDADDAGSLTRSYRLLRAVEHRLQMQADRQTHSLPGSRAGLDGFALFMGCVDGEALAALLLPVLQDTRARFDRLVQPDRPAMAPPDGSDWSGRLESVGFAPSPQAIAILAGWQADRVRALRQPRARALLHGLLPALLQALARQRDPLAALRRFDALLSRQTEGVQLLSLLERNRSLLERIATILGAAPSLADHLASVPAALDGLLLPKAGPSDAATVRRILDRQMRQASDAEEAVHVARRLVRGEEFRLSVARLDGTLDADREGTARTRLAERVIVRMLDQVLAEHRARYGMVPGGGMAVVALGKAGSREMISFSDLDLMLVYDHDPGATGSLPDRRRAGRPRTRVLAASQYYTRLAHALIAALSAPGLEGPLYALDMRLRPSGNKGPVAVSLAAFRRYHAEQAWTWERMALCRARVVAGPPALARCVTASIADALSVLPRDAEAAVPVIQRLRADAAAMRSRLARDLPPSGPWDVRLRPGGLMELEFIAQLLQLARPTPEPGSGRDVRHPTTRVALSRLGRAGLLSRADSALLIEADRFWRGAQGMLRILLGVRLPNTPTGDPPGPLLPEPVLDALLLGLGLPETGPDRLSALEAHRDRVAGGVRAVFLHVIGPVDEG